MQSILFFIPLAIFCPCSPLTAGDWHWCPAASVPHTLEFSCQGPPLPQGWYQRSQGWRRCWGWHWAPGSALALWGVRGLHPLQLRHAVLTLIIPEQRGLDQDKPTWLVKKDVVTVKRSVEKGSLTCQQAGKRFEVKPWGFPLHLSWIDP